MCYKDEVQKKNAEKLQRKFEEDNVPKFIRDYFSFMNSEAGKLNYWGTIKNFLMWCIETPVYNFLTFLKPDKI